MVRNRNIRCFDVHELGQATMNISFQRHQANINQFRPRIILPSDVVC